MLESCSNDALAAGIDVAAMIFNQDEEPRVAFGAPSFNMASPLAKSVMVLGGPGVGTLEMLGDDVEDGWDEGETVAMTQEL